MGSDKPNISSETARRWAEEVYGIDATATPLPGYVDCNYRLDQPDGRISVLKIAHDNDNLLELKAQVEVLRYLEGSSLHTIVPQVIPDLEGRGISDAYDSSGRCYLLRMVSFLDGIPLAHHKAATPALRLEAGRVFGRLDKELLTFDHPGVHRHLVWDLARLLEIRRLSAHVDPTLLPLIRNALERFEKNVIPNLENLRRSVIHNDLNDYNILVREEADGSPVLSGLIDFGDVLHSITVADLAIACAYVMLDSTDPQTAGAEVIAGYEEHMPLDSLERHLIPDLIVGRLCASLLMSAKARLESLENDYLFVSEKPVVALLRRLS